MINKRLSFSRSKFVPVLAAPVLLLAASAPASQAAITVSFDYDGTDTTASISGSLDLVDLTRIFNDIPNFRGNVGGGTTNLFAIGQAFDGGVSDYYRVLPDYTPIPSGLSVIPDVNGTTETFGFSANEIFVPGNTPFNGIFTPPPGQTFVWSNKSLEDIGLGALTTTPTTVWNNPNASGTDGAFQFVRATPITTIPEPSGVLSLGALLGLGLTLRSRR